MLTWGGSSELPFLFNGLWHRVHRKDQIGDIILSIYRGIGGSAASTDTALIDDVTEQAVDAAASATAAASSALSASSSATDAATSATNAANSASNASNSVAASATYANIATTSATAAETSETNAAASETAAAASESAASTSETNAATSATAAATSATNAATSESNASDSETAAGNSATAAASSASAASTSATSASTSATNAASSASSASTSATTATTQAGIATTKATEASASATNASTSETNAAASETAAATSETNAAASESAAATSETNASGSATAAANSATAASASASAASTSETNAAASEAAAASSATSASASADAALAALDSFDDRYLGQKASAPTVDNDGDALVAGALYFNTTTDEMKVYDGSQWLNAYASLSGALIATSNLSDLNNVATARTNLGLGTAATTASTDYATAAQGALADSALQSFTETDPVYTASSWYTTTNNATNWNTAYGWGNHASAGYITDYTVTESDVTAHEAALTIAQSQVTGLSTALAGKVDDSQVLTNVPSGAVFTDTTYSVGNGGLTEINFTSALNTKLAGIATNANNYSHPTYAGDDINLDTGALSGATVISDLDFNVTTDTQGHVTDANATYSTRNLTYSDVGAAASSHSHSYMPLSGGTFTGNISLGNYQVSDVENIYLDNQIISTGDTNTYMQFHSGDQWRVVTGGSERLEVNNSNVTVNNANLDVNNTVYAYRGVGDSHTTSLSGTQTPDFSRYQNFVWTLTGNVTLGNPGDEAVGQSGVFVFIHSGAARTVSLSSDYESVGGAGLSLSGAAGATDIVPYFVAASNRIILGTPQLAFS